jgi:hypothetical protein
MRSIIMLGTFVALTTTALAQAQAAKESPGIANLTPRTYKLLPGASPPAATIQDMAWMAGRWTGPALGGISEETWTPPNAGVMLGAYRLVKDGKTVFYEILTIVEERGSLLIRLKHFNPDLKGWEEKNEVREFPLVKKDAGAMHFEGMSFHSQGKDAFVVYLAIQEKNGTVREETFTYKRER